jgi:hypothetical protein
MELHSRRWFNSTRMKLPGASVLVVVAVLCACAGTASAKTAGAGASQNSCTVIASGNQGGSGSTGQTNVSSTGTAGGVALGKKAVGGLTINCDNYADHLTVTAPGHKFSTTALVLCGGACANTACKAANATTLTCTLSKSLEQEGVKAVGSWQATVEWNYALNDKAATNTDDGTCHIDVVAAIALGGKPTYTGKDLSACAYAKGDVVQ